MNGIYNEKIKFFSDATLVVDKTQFRLQFYYPGPDQRHNGNFEYINSNEIDMYIVALKSNYKKYKEFEAINADGNISSYGKMGMYICANRNQYGSGVTLSVHSRQYIKTDEQLAQAIESLEFVKERGMFVMKFMNRID